MQPAVGQHRRASQNSDRIVALEEVLQKETLDNGRSVLLAEAKHASSGQPACLYVYDPLGRESGRRSPSRESR